MVATARPSPFHLRKRIFSNTFGNESGRRQAQSMAYPADSVHVDRKLETMDQKQRPKLAMTQHELKKDQKVENRRSMTTEQLAEKVIQDIQQMSPEEKAEVRKHLDQAFKRQNPEEKEEDRNNLLHGKQFEGAPRQIRGFSIAKPAHIAKEK